MQGKNQRTFEMVDKNIILLEKNQKIQFKRKSINKESS